MWEAAESRLGPSTIWRLVPSRIWETSCRLMSFSLAAAQEQHWRRGVGEDVLPVVWLRGHDRQDVWYRVGFKFKLMRGSYVNSASAWVFPPIFRLRPANKDPHLGMRGVSWQRAGEARNGRFFLPLSDMWRVASVYAGSWDLEGFFF